MTVSDGVRIGAVFPQTEIGSNPNDIVRFAREAEALGIDHLMAYDHVLGADYTAHPDLSGPYRNEHEFHEPMVLFAFLAGQCALDFVTSVLILPQRQTALVAKQVAALDVLAPGRFRFGVGIGWNHVEYEALGIPFKGRAARMEEQIELLRALWATDVVTFRGATDTVDAAGIRPRPANGIIPIWIGSGLAVEAMTRASRIADGWILPPLSPGESEHTIARMRELVRAEGRDHTAFGFQARIEIGRSAPAIDELAEAWHTLVRAGASHIAFNTMKVGREHVDEHLDALARVTETGVLYGLWDRPQAATPCDARR